MKKIVYGSLSVLTAVFTVFVAAKAEVFEGDRTSEPTSEVVESGQASRLLETPSSLATGLGSPLDGSQSLRLDKNAAKADMSALSSASLSGNAISGNAMGQRGVQATPSQGKIAKRLPASSATSSVFSASPNSAPASFLSSQSVVASPSQVIAQSAPATVPTAPASGLMPPGSTGDEEMNAEEAGAEALRAPTGVTPTPTEIGSPTMDKPVPASGTRLSPASGTGIESEIGAESDTEAESEMESEADLEDADLAPGTDTEKIPAPASGASDLGSPGLGSPGLGSPGSGSPVTPLPEAAPDSGAPDNDVPSSNIPGGDTFGNPTPSTPAGITPSSPGEPAAPVIPRSPATPFPSNPSAAPVEPIAPRQPITPLEPVTPRQPITPLEPIEEDVVPMEVPTSGMESSGSSDRLVGEGFSPFQLSYLAIGGGLEGIPGGDQLLAAYDSGELSAADIVDAGAASSRLGADASDQDDYTAGVERFLNLLSRDNN